MAILSKPSTIKKILEFFPLGLNDLVSSPRFHRTQVAKKYDEGAGGCPTCTHKHSEKEFHLASERLLLASPQSCLGNSRGFFLELLQEKGKRNQIVALLSSSKNDSLLRLHTAAWKCHTL